jgi:hypothetical protein
MVAIPAATQPGRAAKVRALVFHVLHGKLRGDSENLEWDRAMVRALLGEFAGMTAEELAAI